LKRYILLQTLISLAVGLSIAFYAYPVITKAFEPPQLPFVARLDKKIEPTVKQGSGIDSGWDTDWKQEETRGGVIQPTPIDWDLWLTRGANLSAVLVLILGPIGSYRLYRKQQVYVEMLLLLAGEKKNVTTTKYPSLSW